MKKLDEYFGAASSGQGDLFVDVRERDAELSLWTSRRILTGGWTALLCYQSQYGETSRRRICFRRRSEIRERHAAIARFYGNLIGVKYGEPFVVKEAMAMDDIVSMPVRSI